MQKTVLVAFVLARIWKRMATILVRLVMLKAACVRIATTQCSDLRTIPWLIPKAAHVCIAPHCKGLTPGHPLNCTCPHCTDTHLKQTYNITLPSHPSHCTCPACTQNTPYVNTTLPHPHNNTRFPLPPNHNPNHTHTKRLFPPPQTPLSPTVLLAITITTLTLTAILIHTLTYIITKRRAASPSKPPTSSDLETASSHPYTHHPTLPPFKGGDLGSRPDHIHHYNSSYAETRVPGSFAHADAGPDTRGGELERYEEIDVADLWDVNLE